MNGITSDTDRWLVVWNGDSPGTKAGYDYATQRGKSNGHVRAHLINFGVEV